MHLVHQTTHHATREATENGASRQPKMQRFLVFNPTSDIMIDNLKFR